MFARIAYVGTVAAWLFILTLMLPGCERILILDQPIYSDEVMGAPVYIAARERLPQTKTLPIRPGAFGFIVFTSKPVSKESKKRYMAVCEAYMGALPSTESFKASSHVMPTYWPTREVKSQECDEMVAKYDYERASLLASYAGKQSSAGPVLVAWDESPEGNTSPSHQLIFDLSHFSDEDMQRAFLIWKGQFARAPSQWQNGFDLVQIREEFRNFLQKYGDTILELISKKA